MWGLFHRRPARAKLACFKDIMADTPSELRDTNAKIAGTYDRVPYDPTPIPGIDPEYVLGLAALYGAGPRSASYDVLDLGCGTAVQLVRAAAQNGSGRLIGTDLSQSACALATTRCASFGARARIDCADFLDLNAKDLGAFDLIYHVGVLYITPPDVQRHLLGLIAACLKPGGVVLISYHYGPHSLLVAGLRNTLRLAVNRDLDPREQVQSARTVLRTMARTVAQIGGDRHPMLSVFQYGDALEDSIFYHELLGEHFHPLSTAALEGALGEQGVHFLHSIGPGPQGRPAAARERAMMADTLDYAGGGYRYAVFAKTDPLRGPDPKSNVTWKSTLVREGTQTPAVFREPASGLSITAADVSAAALELLAAQPLPWAALAPAVTEKLAARGAAAKDAPKQLEDDLLALWQYALLTPVWHAP